MVKFCQRKKRRKIPEFLIGVSVMEKKMLKTAEKIVTIERVLETFFIISESEADVLVYSACFLCDYMLGLYKITSLFYG